MKITSSAAKGAIALIVAGAAAVGIGGAVEAGADEVAAQLGRFPEDEVAVGREALGPVEQHLDFCCFQARCAVHGVGPNWASLINSKKCILPNKAARLPKAEASLLASICGPVRQPGFRSICKESPGASSMSPLSERPSHVDAV